jgi:hypothetical protein
MVAAARLLLRRHRSFLHRRTATARRSSSVGLLLPRTSPCRACRLLQASPASLAMFSQSCPAPPFAGKHRLAVHGAAESGWHRAGEWRGRRMQGRWARGHAHLRTTKPTRKRMMTMSAMSRESPPPQTPPPSLLRGGWPLGHGSSGLHNLLGLATVAIAALLQMCSRWLLNLRCCAAARPAPPRSPTRRSSARHVHRGRKLRQRLPSSRCTPPGSERHARPSPPS